MNTYQLFCLGSFKQYENCLALVKKELSKVLRLDKSKTRGNKEELGKKITNRIRGKENWNNGSV